jgi:hypothetical protein
VTIMQQVGEADRSASLKKAGWDFIHYGKSLLWAKGNRDEALKYALHRGAGARLEAMLKSWIDLASLDRLMMVEAALPVDEIRQFAMVQKGPSSVADIQQAIVQKAIHHRAMLQKAPVNVGTIDGGTWGGQALAPFVESSAGFVAGLSPYSAFDRMMADGAVKAMPLRTVIFFAEATALATVADVAEAIPKPVFDMTFDQFHLTAYKAARLVAISNELTFSVSPSANELFAARLRAGIALATDKKFISIISTGVPSHASSGLTAAQFQADVATARNSINEGVESQLYLILPPKTYGAVSLLRDGSPLVVNGMLGDDVRVIRSGGATTSGVLVDASAVAAGSELVVLDRAKEDVIELNDNPTAGSSKLFPLWANNCQCLRAERYFGAQLMRTDGACVISGYSG